MTEHYPTAPQVVEPVEILSEVKCTTRELETIFSHLGGETIDVPVNVLHYPTCYTSIVVIGKKEDAPGELYCPFGIAIQEDTHQIFVVDWLNNRAVIFSETGEFLYQLGVDKLSRPSSIAIHGDSVYVSCTGDATVSKLSLAEMCHVGSIGGEGSDNGQFNSPIQLTTDTIGRVFIADLGNDRICIHDPHLNHLRNITLQSMSGSSDVKVFRDHLYVLCRDDNPCVHVLTLLGDKLHSLIACGEGMDLLRPHYFCLDLFNNIVISDFKSRSICIFSPEGNLLHKIGRNGHTQRIFFEPTGVAIIPNGKLVCVSFDENYCLQVFS